MADGGFAICLLITLAFAVFIVWGRTVRGQEALRQTFGERQPGHKPKVQPRRSAGSNTGKANTSKTASGQRPRTAKSAANVSAPKPVGAGTNVRRSPQSKTGKDATK